MSQTATGGTAALNIVIRISLAILFITELVVGAWNQFSPETFYRYFPSVTLTPPFSEHFARDFGGATLGIAVLLGVAMLQPAGRFPLPAAIAYSVYSVPHFVFHVTHLQNASVIEAVSLTVANAFVALIGLLVIVLVVARDRRVAVQFRRATASPQQ